MPLLQFDVVAKREEQRRVYGYASVAVTKDGKPVVDLQGDLIDPADLEDTAAEFVKEYRQGGEMHQGAAPSELIASVVLTDEVQKALGIPPGVVPQAWFVGFEVPPETFAKVKEGSRLMFSIEGEAQREEIAKTPPWKIEERDGKFLVMGQENGKVYGTHPTKEKAAAHMRALYANVPDAREGK